MLIYLSTLLGDWAHNGLLLGSILSEICVAIGIILETPKEKTCRERVGMGLVIGGVVFGAFFTIALFIYDEGSARAIYNVAQTASRTAAGQGVQIVQQQSQVSEALGRIAKLEDRTAKLESGAGRPAPPAAAPPPISSAGPRHLSSEAAHIIRSTTLPGATVSIIPFMPGELQTFADELGAVFATVPGAQVAVGHDNMIMNGQTGLIVQYDHSNPVSVSVFKALAKAGLRPIDGPPVTGSVVFIKVAPP